MTGVESPARAWAALTAGASTGRGPRDHPLRGRAVHGLELGPGRLAARVAEQRGPERDVALTWPVADEAVWRVVAAALAGRARWFAAILDGTIDAALAEELAASGIALVPHPGALAFGCTCGRGDWCAHALAVHAAATTRIVRDPALLLALAGRPRAALLADLRRELGVAEVRAAPVTTAAAASDRDAALASVVVAPSEPREASALVARLGPPPGLDDEGDLATAVDRAAALAWRLVVGVDEAPGDDMLVLALRAGGTMGSVELAAQVGGDAAQVAAALERLHAAGAVLRTGPEGLRRYRAP